MEGASTRAEKRALMRELRDKLTELELPTQIEDRQKEFYGSVSRLGKSIDKHFKPEDFGNRETKLDEGLLDQVVANHFFREGQPELGQTFCDEAKVSVSADLKRAFLDMHAVVSELRNHNLLPALEWVRQRRESSAGETSGNRTSSPLEF